MSRKQKYTKRKKNLDKVYQNELIAKFINKVMKDGKKTIAEKIVYTSLDNLAKETNKPVLECFNEVINNVSPKMEVKSRRVGGSTYQVPVEVEKRRAQSLAIRWVIGFARDKSGSAFIDRLSKELLDGFNGTGSAIKKKDDTHKMAEANKAFAHFRW
ncbi:MAG: 30S ribosomal protein S7 [Rickettsiales bacterium]|nr:30S ribosomal protein S7 [Rickettsiales bacterium]|tara:strand:+ start:79 stop:549 length:471 start_codon:yes stop_codon:yes gene_type:complete